MLSKLASSQGLAIVSRRAPLVASSLRVTGSSSYAHVGLARRGLSVWSERVKEKRPCATKIVATIGPASEQAEPLQQIVSAGMRVMRVNFSHATFEEFDLRQKNLRAAKGIHGENFNLRAVLLDTQGPEVRTGSVDPALGVKEFTMTKGDKCVLTTDETYRDLCTPERMFVTYKKLAESLKVGGTVLLDDGLVGLEVQSILPNGDIECLVQNTGPMSSKKGVNMPGAKLDLPAMSDKDKIDIEYGLKNDIDFIAASFVRKPADVEEIRDFAAPIVAKYFGPEHPVPKIISKIESTEAIENFDEILAASDGIMVARGDLGVEIPMAQLTNAQKFMVTKCNLAGKPVIVATQMLESMQKNPRPTRAEVSDVTNAVHDGADAVMLSGESAKGKYPVQSVQMMNGIIDEAERWIESNSRHANLLDIKVEPGNLLESVCHAAVDSAHTLKAQCIIVLTRKGNTAQTLAKYRPNCPIMAFTPNAKVARQLILTRGVHPMVNPALVQSTTNVPIASDNVNEALTRLDNNAIISMAIAQAKRLGLCSAGSSVVVVSSEPSTAVADTVLSFRIIKVKDFVGGSSFQAP